MDCSDSLAKQIEFIREIDKLKQVFRQTYLMDDTRKENDAEHSWHLAMMIILLAEHAADDIDVLRAVKMVLIHDIVEIDAGDTFCYDTEGYKTKAAREQAAADRIFNILPAGQAQEIRALWDEFEARQTPEAKFAAAVDRLQPIMHNFATAGRAWREHGITADQVISRNKHIADGSPALWQFTEQLITTAVEKGYLSAKED